MFPPPKSDLRRIYFFFIVKPIKYLLVENFPTFKIIGEILGAQYSYLRSIGFSKVIEAAPLVLL